MKIVSIFFYLLTGIINFANAQNVFIPDANFKSYLLNNPEINTNGDDKIQITEAEAFTGTIDCNSRSINSLEGIEKFINITELVCYSNSLTHLFLPENKKLTKINCSNNDLTYLDTSNNLFLTDLTLSYNELDFLDFSNNLMLKNLFINANNPLTHLNINENVNLEYLYCFGNNLNSIDLTHNLLLKSLNIGENALTNLDLSKNTNLEELYFGNTQLSNLDISKNIKLKILDVFDNPLLTNLDVSKNIFLTDFRCPRNAISNINVSALTSLQKFYCHENQITNLDVSKNTLLIEFSCFGNQITDLDVSKNIALTLFSCRNNSLNSLNMKNGNNSAISTFRATNNPNLTCIKVDNVEYANSQPNWLKDSIANYNINCSLSVENTNRNEIQIFPIPAQDVLNFSEAVNNVRILDFTGKIIIQMNELKKSINISNLTSGQYLIILTLNNGNKVTKKFSKN